MLERNEDIGRDTGTVNPMVFECNDGHLNDIRGLHVTEQNALDALANAADDFEEGAVGAGSGMSCYSLKGGIGSASRVFELYGNKYTVSALLLTNFGTLRDLTIGGERVGERLYQKKEAEKAARKLPELSDDAKHTVTVLRRAKAVSYTHLTLPTIA